LDRVDENFEVYQYVERKKREESPQVCLEGRAVFISLPKLPNLYRDNHYTLEMTGLPLWDPISFCMHCPVVVSH
jgi:hypothetical protein